MYYFISGKLFLVDEAFAVIDNNGIGYKLFITAKTAGALFGKESENVRLYTYFSVKEDAEELYGFYSIEEKEIFELLISISGVGPKAAMAILSALSPRDFTMAVLSDDAKTISSAQGIGLRTAQKIILELKDKLSKGQSVPIVKAAASKSKVSSNMQDALLTLEALGYTRSESLQAMTFEGSDTLEVEVLIKEALKRLTRQ